MKLVSWRQDAVEKASTQQSGPSGPRLSSCSLGDQTSLETRPIGEKMLEWEHFPERLGPQVRGWAAQENGKETRLWPIERRVNMLQFCSVSNSLSHATFQIKWEVYFSKNCVARLYCVSFILHAYVDVYVLCVCIVGHGHGYTTILIQPTVVAKFKKWYIKEF